MRVILLIAAFFLAGCQTVTTLPERPEDLTFVAHRGITSERLPENTILAFKNVIERDIAIVELDVRTTSDGYMIIMHDPMVDRTTDGSGFVRHMTFNEIRELDAGEGEVVPTLEEVFDLFANTNVDLLLDIKDQNIDILALITEIEIRDMQEQVILGARFPAHVRAFKALNPSIRVLGFTPDSDATQEFVESGIDIIRFKMKWLDRQATEILDSKKHGLPIWITSYTPTRLELNIYSAYGVSAVITDNI